MSKRRFPLNKFPELLKNPPPNLDIMLYDKKKEGPTPHPGDDTVKKKTLSQRLDELTEIVTNGFKRVDNLTNDFNSFKQEINARLDNVEKRLDYCGLQIEKIEKRLDYNNLKALPNNR